MVNPGAFQGHRKEFLLGQKPYYASAVAGGYVKDALAIVQRRFFKRFPVEMPLDQEPSLEELAAIDDDSPDEEQPDIDSALEGNLLDAEVNRRLERATLIEKRRGQITRWLQYQYMKDNDVDPRDGVGLTPNRILYYKLTGKGIEKPRQKTPKNLWRKTQRENIEKQVKEEAKKAKDRGEKVDLITLRDRFARQGFQQLGQDERDEWKEKALEEHRIALEQFERDTTQPPPTDPESRQRAIQNITAFIQPILDLVCETTGWKGSVVFGGPEPAKNGELTILSVHSGETKGDMKMNFGRSERPWYKDQFVRAYGSFLRKCYSPEDCRSMALTSEAVIDALDAHKADAAGGSVDVIGWDGPAPSSSANGTPPNANIASSSSPPAAPVARPPLQPTREGTTPTTISSSLQKEDITVTATSHLSTQDVDAGSLTLNDRVAPRSITPPTPGLGHFNPVFQMPNSPNAPNLRDSVGPTTPGALPASPVTSPTPPSHHIEQSSNNSTPPLAPKEAMLVNVAVTSTAQKRKRVVKDAVSKEPIADERDDQKRRKTVAKGKNGGGHAGPIPGVAITLGSSSLPSTAASTTTATPPSAAPAWFTSIHGMLLEANLGPQWRRLVQTWAEFEAQEAFKATPNLKAVNRPEQIGKWVKNYRSPTFRLPISSIPAYSNSFVAWWTSLQPEWRLEGGSIVFDRLDGDWSVLRRSGVNGLVSVLVALLFWGERLSEQEYADGKWAEMVKDITHVCTQLQG